MAKATTTPLRQAVQDAKSGAVAPCEWFALCDHEATTVRRHPILGDVPICERCDAKVEALS